MVSVLLMQIRIGMTPKEVRACVDPELGKVCFLYRIPLEWLQAIITIESNWNPFAVRYEPDYAYLFEPTRFANGSNTYATEVSLQKTSFGLGQIMGGLAREQKLKGPLTQLIDPGVNLAHVGTRLRFLMNKSEDPDTVFAGYNGGPGAMRKLQTGFFPNQKYVDKINQHLTKAD